MAKKMMSELAKYPEGARFSFEGPRLVVNERNIGLRWFIQVLRGAGKRELLLYSTGK